MLFRHGAAAAADAPAPLPRQTVHVTAHARLSSSLPLPVLASASWVGFFHIIDHFACLFSASGRCFSAVPMCQSFGSASLCACLLWAFWFPVSCTAQQACFEFESSGGLQSRCLCLPIPLCSCIKAEISVTRWLVTLPPDGILTHHMNSTATASWRCSGCPLTTCWALPAGRCVRDRVRCYVGQVHAMTRHVTAHLTAACRCCAAAVMCAGSTISTMHVCIHRSLYSVVGSQQTQLRLSNMFGAVNWALHALA